MMELLYHAPDNPILESPFDRAIVEVVHGQDVGIVSPYIGVRYLRRLIALSSSWRVVSDVLEWLSATPVSDRTVVFDFLKEYEGRIHHYPDIHAKTVVSPKGVYTGSANLTDAGVLRRTEFGVLITEPSQVQEVQQWFEAVWIHASPPRLSAVQNLIVELNQLSNVPGYYQNSRTLDSNAPRVRAKLVSILGLTPTSLNDRMSLKDLNESSISSDNNKISLSLAPLFSSSNTPTPENATSSYTLAKVPIQPIDLDSEIDNFIYKNASRGFTFAGILRAMRKLSPSLTRGEVYLVILDRCASHPRSLFSDEGVNRLVYRNGKFEQSNKDLLMQVLQPMDDLVQSIISQLSFQNPTADLRHVSIPDFSISAQRLVLDGMERAGFVRRTSSGLTLVKTATWSTRLKLLERSHSRWVSQITHQVFRKPPQQLAESADQTRDVDLAQDAAVSSYSGLDASTYNKKAEDNNLYKFHDLIFTHLARMRCDSGMRTNVPLKYLKAELVSLTGQNENVIARLIDGTTPGFRSPFVVEALSAMSPVTIYSHLVGNPHLDDLPRLMSSVKSSPILKKLLNRDDGEISEAVPPLIRVKLEGLKERDQSYLVLVKWISKVLPPTDPMDEEQICSFLSASGLSEQLVSRLFFENSAAPALFQVRYIGPTKRLKIFEGNRALFNVRFVRENLELYPETHRYLKTVVWPSGIDHEWIQSLEQQKMRAIREHQLSTIEDLRRDLKRRDKEYAQLIDVISQKIPHSARYRSQDELVGALAGSDSRRFQIEYLLNIGHSLKDALMHVVEDERGSRPIVDIVALKFYKRSVRRIESLMTVAREVHPWLLPAVHHLVVLSKKGTDLLRSPPQRGVSPLQWVDLDYYKLDSLYSELVEIFIIHGQSVLRVSESKKSKRSSAVAKYMEISTTRKAFKVPPSPALSLDIAETTGEIELVIYAGAKSSLRFFPKLQRVLARGKFSLREV